MEIESYFMKKYVYFDMHDYFIQCPTAKQQVFNMLSRLEMQHGIYISNAFLKYKIQKTMVMCNIFDPNNTLEFIFILNVIYYNISQ